MPPKFTARQLQYDAPPVPTFLKQLHSQVNARNGSIDDKRPHRREDELDDLLGGASRGNLAKGKDGEGDAEEEDEWDGAQVVVLKEGRHLSKEDVEAARSTKVQDAEGSTTEPIAKLEAGTSTCRSSKRSGGKMQGVKDLIAQSKENTSEEQSEADQNRKRKIEKQRAREEKNKKARVEKSKRGKGLSFDMND